MKTLLHVAAATVALLGVVGTGSTAQAQNAAGANAQKYNIAVVDISYVFKNHKRHQATIEAMKTARRGELAVAGSADNLLEMLNAGD